MQIERLLYRPIARGILLRVAPNIRYQGLIVSLSYGCSTTDAKVVIVRGTSRFVTIAIVGCTILNALNTQNFPEIHGVYIVRLLATLARPPASTASTTSRAVPDS